MKLKKANAVLALLAILIMLMHVGYSVFAYLTMYYNPFLSKLFAWSFMVIACLHAVCGMLAVFLQSDGTRLDQYPKKNLRTILQRVSAALIFPLLILHINTFALMKGCHVADSILKVLKAYGLSVLLQVVEEFCGVKQGLGGDAAAV